MEPRIQYAKTSDGVSIAYAVWGTGPPLVVMNLPISHIQLEWQITEVRQTYELAARLSTCVRFDHRGFGLSDRDISVFSVEAMLLDLEAVADRIGLGTFNIIAVGFAPPLALAFAARHPERVSRLILWPGITGMSDEIAEVLERLFSMAEDYWDFVTESLVHFGQGWSDQMSAPAAATFRAAVTRMTLMDYVHQMKEWDITALLPQVAAPTLLVHDMERDRSVKLDTVRDLASVLPDARVAILEGASRSERMAQIITAIMPFLGQQSPPPAPVEPRRPPSGTAIILFADIADSTGLTERLGDAAFRDKARELDGALRAAIHERGGTPVEGKLLGDGVLAVFTSAREAIGAALACGQAGWQAGLALHLGIHAGDVIREEGNVYGGAVNIASRIAGLSAAGEVLVSETVRSLARTSAGVRFEDRGRRKLKGVAEAARVWAVTEADR